MGKKMVRFPISYSQRRKNSLGPLCVECQVSGRRLQFSPSSTVLSEGEFITVDVMTQSLSDDEPAKKICGLIVTREDLELALKSIFPKE